jgi:enoyl-[acyl-carrier protein] reductase III
MRRPLDFSGKRALVTGASRGLGAVIARRLAACGAEVWLNARRTEAGARAVAEEIAADGGRAVLAPANLIHPHEIHEMFETLRRAGGRLDILIHNAALGAFKPTEALRANQWDLTMAVGARALLLCAQEASDLMDRGGKIVSVSSLGSQRVTPHYGAIGASKAALESLTRYLAAALAPRAINVNAVSAGPLDTETIRRHPLHATLAQNVVARTPAGRLGAPDDVASVVLFLCSPLADWIVGQTIVADGGLSLPL